MVKTSVARRSAVFGMAIAVSHVSQLMWIVVGARVLGIDDLGRVLAAQALYGLLQVLLDTGSLLHGARLAATNGVTPEIRGEVCASRLLIALAGLAVSMPILTIVATGLVGPFLPYAPALLLFALLNVWEPYGEGQAGAYAFYVALRSTVVAVAVVIVYAIGQSMPPIGVGLCEIVAVLITGFAFRAWTLPREARFPARAFWRSIRDVGGPSLITQATYSAGTLVLGAAGNTTAAAVAGVGTRLLTGLQGLSGTVTAGLFPTIAGGHSSAHGRAARLIPVGIVALCLVVLSGACLLNTWLITLLLGRHTPFAENALLMWLGGAASSGYVMHLTFVLVAQHLEVGLVRISAAGLAGAVAGAMAATIVGGPQAAVVAGAGFMLGQVGVLLAVSRRVHACSRAWLSWRLVIISALVAPAAAILGALWPVVGALVAACGTVAATLRISGRLRFPRATTGRVLPESNRGSP